MVLNTGEGEGGGGGSGRPESPWKVWEDKSEYLMLTQ